MRQKCHSNLKLYSDDKTQYLYYYWTKRYCKARFNNDLRIEGIKMEHELEEVERDYIEFRKEMGEE